MRRDLLDRFAGTAAVLLTIACSSEGGGQPPAGSDAAGGATGGTGASGGGSGAGSGGSSGSGSGGTSGSSGSAGSGGSAASGGSGTGGSGTGGAGGSGGSSGTSGNCTAAPVQRSKATHYTLATPLVHCSYPSDSLPQYYAALNEEDYASAAMCGACLRVTGPSGASIDVQIVDECPYQGNEQWCYPGSHHVDLNQPAFSQLANLSQGVIDISWQIVPCDVQGDLSFTFKEGSSQYWTAVMVRNHPQPLAKVEYSSATSGGYRELRREDYNYWLADNGFGNGPYSIRVSDVTGAVVEQTGLAALGTSPIGSDMTVSGNVQLPACP